MHLLDFFFGCSLLFWLHNSPLALPVNLLVMRYSFFYCQSLEIKLSPHIPKWKAARYVCLMEILKVWSPPIQAKDTHNPIKGISVLKHCENNGFSTSFLRKATTYLLDRTKSQYLVFSVWWGLKRTGKDSKHQSTHGKWQLYVISLPLISAFPFPSTNFSIP